MLPADNVRNFLAHNSTVGNGCAKIMGACNFRALSAWNPPHTHNLFSFWVGVFWRAAGRGRSEVRILFYGREDFSETWSDMAVFWNGV